MNYADITIIIITSIVIFLILKPFISLHRARRKLRISKEKHIEIKNILQMQKERAINTAINTWLDNPRLNIPKEYICPDINCGNHLRYYENSPCPINPCSHSIPHRTNEKCIQDKPGKQCPKCIRF